MMFFVKWAMLRQYIQIAESRFQSSTILLWMLRPTVNYMDFIFVCDSNRYSSIISVIMGVKEARSMGKDIRNGVSFKYSSYEMTIEVRMSGTLVPYFLCSEACSQMDIHIQSVFLGGCTLNLTLIKKDSDNNPVLCPVAFNSSLMTSITSPEANMMRTIEISQELRKSTMKFRRVGRGTIVGPTLTIGENGGFQWIGNPSSVSITMSQAFSHMSMRMSSAQFRQALSNSRIGTLGQYPLGVAKR